MSNWINNLSGGNIRYFAACGIIDAAIRRSNAPMVCLGEHCDILSGYAFKSKDFTMKGVRLLRNINVKPDAIDWTEQVSLPANQAAEFARFSLAKGDLIMSMDGPLTKQGLKIAFVSDEDVPALLLQRVCRFDVDDCLRRPYLYHILHCDKFVRHLAASNRSIAIPHVSAQQLKAFKLPHPSPADQELVAHFLTSVQRGDSSASWPRLPAWLSEQRPIVAKIEQLAAKIDEARGLRATVITESEYVYSSALSEVIPRDTQSKTLREVIDPQSRISYGVLVPGPDVEDGIPLVRVQDLDARNPPVEPSKRIAAQMESSYARTRLDGTEVLVTVVGATIGKIGIVPHHWKGANVARAICRVVPGHKVRRDYLIAVLQSSATQQYFKETTRTLAQPTLNVKQLAETLIPLPSLDEQRRIVEYLDRIQAKMDRLKALQSQSAAELDALLPSILDKAFKGEL